MENKIIETPFQKIKVEIKPFLTAGDEFEIQKVVYDSAEVMNGVSGVTGSKGDIMKEMEMVLMDKAVVSINGKKENLRTELLSMAGVDYNFVKAEVDKIRDYEELKKKSLNSTEDTQTDI